MCAQSLLSSSRSGHKRSGLPTPEYAFDLDPGSSESLEIQQQSLVRSGSLKPSESDEDQAPEPSETLEDAVRREAP